MRIPTAQAGGIRELEIIVDSYEQYPFRFASQQVRTVRPALPCGDYALTVDGRLVASVERKSLPDLVASLTGGKLELRGGRAGGATPGGGSTPAVGRLSAEVSDT